MARAAYSIWRNEAESWFDFLKLAESSLGKWMCFVYSLIRALHEHLIKCLSARHSAYATVQSWFVCQAACSGYVSSAQKSVSSQTINQIRPSNQIRNLLRNFSKLYILNYITVGHNFGRHKRKRWENQNTNPNHPIKDTQDQESLGTMTKIICAFYSSSFFSRQFCLTTRVLILQDHIGPHWPRLGKKVKRLSTSQFRALMFCSVPDTSGKSPQEDANPQGRLRPQLAPLLSPCLWAPPPKASSTIFVWRVSYKFSRN